MADANREQREAAARFVAGLYPVGETAQRWIDTGDPECANGVTKHLASLLATREAAAVAAERERCAGLAIEAMVACPDGIAVREWFSALAEAIRRPALAEAKEKGR